MSEAWGVGVRRLPGYHPQPEELRRRGGSWELGRATDVGVRCGLQLASPVKPWPRREGAGGMGNLLLVAAIGSAQIEALAREPHRCSQLGLASVESGSGEADGLASAGAPAPWVGQHVGSRGYRANTQSMGALRQPSFHFSQSCFHAASAFPCQNSPRVTAGKAPG